MSKCTPEEMINHFTGFQGRPVIRVVRRLPYKYLEPDEPLTDIVIEYIQYEKREVFQYGHRYSVIMARHSEDTEWTPLTLGNRTLTASEREALREVLK